MAEFGSRWNSETIEAHAESSRALDIDTVPCRLCSTLTRMTGTRLCDRCWELETRIQHSPEIARKILSELEQ